MAEENPISDLSAILAGERVEVSFLNGARRFIFVRALPASLVLTDYMALLAESEAAMLARVCSPLAGEPELPKGWIDALTDESHEALVDLAERLNFARGARQAERQAKRMKGLKAIETKALSVLGISPKQP